MSSPLDKKLDARARQLLRTLIAQYIADGQPVGSRTLARHSGLDVSAATIRNVMADLEEIGLLAAPHTSAGRMPTAQGYRMFVDSLIEMQPLGEPELEQLRRELPTDASTPDLLGSATSLLSEMTRFVGVVSVPKREEFPFRHIDFVALGGNRVLTILVFADNDVQNRVVTTQRIYGAGELEQIANFLNAQFCRAAHRRNPRAPAARNARDQPQPQHAAHGRGRGRASRVPGQRRQRHAGRRPNQPDGLAGGSGDMDRLRELFEAFQRKRDLLLLLENCASAEGVRLFIGEESGFAALDGCSLVTAPYGVGGRVLGVLGVIGPTRMAYQRVIPVVQATAQIVSNALKQAQPTL